MKIKLAQLTGDDRQRKNAPVLIGKLIIQRILVNSKGYDRRGGFWGAPSKTPLYCAEDENGFQSFARLNNYDAAHLYFTNKYKQTR